MAASKYLAGTKVVFFDRHQLKLVQDEIWLVRQGYYHMPNDDYLHDEDIVGAIVDGKRVLNDLFQQDRVATITMINRELAAADQWIKEAAGAPV